MKEGHTLFELIHSLSTSEKRYLNSYFFQKKGKYAQLYQAIQAQKEYDEVAIREKFTGETFLRQLAVAKSYLYDLILRALRGYHRERTPGIRMRGELDKIELLSLRNLHEQSQKLLKKLKAKAVRLEVWTIHLDCLQMEMRMVRRSGEPEIRSILTNLMCEQEYVLEMIRQESELRKLYDTVFNLRRKNETLRDWKDAKALQLAMASPMLQADKPISVRLAVLYTYAHLYAAQLRGEQETVIQHYQSLIAIWESDPQVMRHDEERYLRALLSYLDIATSSTSTAAIDALFSKIENLSLQLPSLKSLRNHYLFHLRIRYLANHKRFAECIAFVSENRSQLAEILTTSDQALRMTLLHNLLILHFLHAEYSIALEFAEALIQEKNLSIRSDVQLFARLLLLPIHFELGHFAILESILRSSRRYFTRHTDLLPFEQQYFKFFRNLIHAVDRHETRQIFKTFLPIIQQIASQNPILGLEELILWLKQRNK